LKTEVPKGTVGSNPTTSARVGAKECSDWGFPKRDICAH
jgi:hypothetical protein